MSRQLRERRDEQSAFVLHTYPYRETSLIVEAFTASWGRVAMVARGAKRPRSELRGLLNAFQPLILSWAGTGELKTLLGAEWRGGLALPSGAALLCGFYLNELLLKLLPREDAHPQLWTNYESALVALTEHPAPAEQAATLRRFELRLLTELGYAMPLTHEHETGAPIVPAERYHYAFDRGPRRSVGEPLARLDFSHSDDALEAKRLMRDVLDHYLETRVIASRRIVRELHALEEEDGAR